MLSRTDFVLDAPAALTAPARRSHRLGLLACFVLPLAAYAESVAFNRDVRPILSDRCFACHGPDSGNRKANLRLDQEAASRAVIVPGDAAASKLVQRIKSQNNTLRMPPAYLGHPALPEGDVRTLEAWIQQGAKYERHWSLIPPRKAAIPSGSHPIDHFIRAALAAKGLRPSPEAPREALIRRVTLALTGLPPTPEEVDAFLRDTSPDAYEKVVDRLLASRRFAERAGMRWLEAARYADTNGYQTDGPRLMWRWRDWVLDAFHRNMPFDRFLIEQLAGDLLPNPTRDQLIATGFNRNHRTNAEAGIIDEEFRIEYVADRAETTATVFLGLTAGCARCHDHKYDPLTQRDYYRLFAFFNQVPEKGYVYNLGNEEPYIKAPTPEMARRLAELDAKLAAAEKRWSGLQPAVDAAVRNWEAAPGSRDAQWAPADDRLLSHAGSRFDGAQGISAGHGTDVLTHTDPFTFSAWVKSEAGDGAILSKSEDDWESPGHALYLVDGKLRLHLIGRYSDQSMRVETANRVTVREGARITASYDGSRKPKGVHIYVDGAEQELKILFDQLNLPIKSTEPFRIGAGGGKRFRGEIRDVYVWRHALSPVEVAALAGKNQAARMRLAYLDLAPSPAIAEAHKALKAARRERDAFEETIPTVMVMQDQTEPRDTFVLRRGQYDARGEKVSAAVPGFLPPLPAGTPANRLSLARWLVSRNNPLTARVTVNRFWQMIYGAGLVRTVEDFGSQGEWPSHPELLDWLAVEFMDTGWDVKRLFRTLVTSTTFRQSSRLTPEALAQDAGNRYYARASRLRYAPEMIRDQALFVSGLVVEKFGGPSVKPYQPPGLWKEVAIAGDYKHDSGEGLYRRSLYTYWRRAIAPPSMVVFDSPTRDNCTVRETRTNTPLQALNLMNDTIYVESARKLAERMMRTPDPIQYGFRAVLGRRPREAESALLRDAYKKLLARYDSDPKAVEQILAQGEAPRDRALPAAQLAAYANVASMILNLDEAVTVE